MLFRSSRVVSNSRVGNEMKSLKFLMFKAAINTMIERPMLKVNNTSSNNVGRGTSIITRMSKTSTGMATWADEPFKDDNLSRKVFIKIVNFIYITSKQADSRLSTACD